MGSIHILRVPGVKCLMLWRFYGHQVGLLVKEQSLPSIKVSIEILKRFAVALANTINKNLLTTHDTKVVHEGIYLKFWASIEWKTWRNYLSCRMSKLLVRIWRYLAAMNNWKTGSKGQIPSTRSRTSTRRETPVILAKPILKSYFSQTGLVLFLFSSICWISSPQNTCSNTTIATASSHHFETYSPLPRCGIHQSLFPIIQALRKTHFLSEKNFTTVNYPALIPPICCLGLSHLGVGRGWGL